jgi:heme/copper-type cytochrome/quinol oxidase subunit 4
MSEPHSVDFKSYLRRCAYVFIAVVCTTSLMIYASFLPHTTWAVKVAAILAIACVNALVVAGSLMHLLSEKKAIYTTLAFTVFFFAGLMGLTMWAMHDFPTGTQTH